MGLENVAGERVVVLWGVRVVLLWGVRVPEARGGGTLGLATRGRLPYVFVEN